MTRWGWLALALALFGGRALAADEIAPHKRRGHSYAGVMARRDGGAPNHKVWDVEGVGHDGDKMLTSPCGLAALFDLPGCVAPR